MDHPQPFCHLDLIYNETISPDNPFHVIAISADAYLGAALCFEKSRGLNTNLISAKCELTLEELAVNLACFSSVSKQPERNIRPVHSRDTGSVVCSQTAIEWKHL